MDAITETLAGLFVFCAIAILALCLDNRPAGRS